MSGPCAGRSPLRRIRKSAAKKPRTMSRAMRDDMELASRDRVAARVRRRTPRMCRQARSPPERGEDEAGEGGEHRDRDDPAERGEDRADGLIAHDLCVPRGEHDHDEEWWRRNPVQDGGEEERVDWLDPREWDRESDDRRERDDAVERPRPMPVLVEPFEPTERLRNGVGGCAREHRYREKTGADHADREGQAREVPRERTERLRGVAARVDVPDPAAAQRHGRREDDEIHDEVRDEHPDGYA